MMLMLLLVLCQQWSSCAWHLGRGLHRLKQFTHEGDTMTSQHEDAQLPEWERYVSPGQLEKLYPYGHRSWRRFVHAGLLPGTLRPFGAKGRMLIPLDEARALMQRSGEVSR